MPTLDPVILHFRPTTFHSLSWSADAELAIAAGDSIEILLPKYQTALKQWDTLRFHADIFTQAEFSALPLPVHEGFSVGEESQVTYITNLRWSGPGIAKHRRCALGALTANHVLCVYASEGNPRDLTSWKRVLLVNDCVRRYWEEVDAEMSELLRRRRARVLGFAWSEGLKMVSQIGAKQTLLAVSNDNHEILILRVKTRYANDQPSHGSWDIKVLAHFDVRGPHYLGLSSSPPFGHIPVTSMSLSPWIQRTEGGLTVYDTVVAYTSHEYVGLRRISICDYKGPDAEVEVTINSKDTGSYCGWISPGSTIIWDSQVYTDRDFKVRGMLSTLFSVKYFSENGFDRSDNEVNSQSSSKEKELEEEETGDDAVDLIQTEPTSQNSKPSLEDDKHANRTCGVEEVERLIINDPISGIAITPMHPNQPTSDLSENTHYLRHHAVDDWYQDFSGKSESPTFIRAVAISSMNKSQISSSWGLALSPGSSILATIMTAQPAQTIEFTTTASAASTIHFSLNPRRVYHSLNELGHISTEGLVFEATYGDYGIDKEDFPFRKNLLKASKSLATHVHQICVFCGEVITLIDEEESICSNGHVFENCASTSLAVQGPGLTRSCGICGYRCLKADEIKKALGDEEHLELAGISGDLCGYCGGKFVD